MPRDRQSLTLKTPYSIRNLKITMMKVGIFSSLTWKFYKTILSAHIFKNLVLKLNLTVDNHVFKLTQVYIENKEVLKTEKIEELKSPRNSRKTSRNRSNGVMTSPSKKASTGKRKFKTPKKELLPEFTADQMVALKACIKKLPPLWIDRMFKSWHMELPTTESSLELDLKMISSSKLRQLQKFWDLVLQKSENA